MRAIKPSLSDTRILISPEDESLLRKHYWGVYDKGYAARNNGYGVMFLHRVIMARMLGRYLVGKEQVDHINCIKTDCRRENLRLADQSQQQANRKKTLNRGYSSQFKGVSWINRLNRWGAGIRVDGKSLYLGYFRSEEEAATTYDKAAMLHFGEYARLNFSEQSYAAPQA